MKYRVIHKETRKVVCEVDCPKAAEHTAKAMNRMYRTTNFVVEAK
jgi:hypothetical protein